MYGTSFIVNLTGYVLDALRATGSTLLNGLVSYWPLDEVSGTRYDLVGSNDLTDNNTVGAKLRGPEGTVASFVAANSEYLSSTFTFDADSPITFAGWVRFNSISGNYSLLHSGNYNFDVRLTNGYPQMFVNGSGVAVGGAPSEQAVDQWHFWLAWYDPAEAKAYMQTDSGTVYSAAAAANGATTQTSLGRTNGVGGYWDGEVSSASLWTRVLTSDERTALFAAGNGLRYADLPAGLLTSLVSWWELDEVSGVRYDSHGSNDLTDNNTVGSVNSGPKGVVGSFVAANNESLSRASNSSLQLTTAWTYASWFRTTDTGLQMLVAKDLDGGSREFGCYSNLGDRFSVEVYGLGTVGHSYINTRIGDGLWHLFAVKVDGTDVRFWLDGDTALSAGASGAPVQSTNKFMVGDRGDGTYPWDGGIGPAAMWQRVVGDSELEAIFNSGRGKRYADLTDGEKVGLVSYWNLDEQSGVRYDSHGSNDLTDNNTVGSVINAGDAMDGAAASFVAANTEYLSRSSYQMTGDDGSFTVSLWHYIPDLSANRATGFFDATLAWTLAASQVSIYNATANATNYVALVSDGVGAYQFANYTRAGLSIGWHHLLAWYDSDDRKVRLSIDGSAPTGSEASAALAGTTRYTSPVELWVGDHRALASYQGQLDEVAIWDRVLTEDERTELFNLGRGKYYDFA